MTVRNKRGMGSITKNPSGTYRVELKFTDMYGNKQKFQQTVPTESKAKKLLEKFRRDVKRAKKAQTQDVNNYSIERYFREIYLPYKESTLKPQSYRRIESTVDSHIIPAHGLKIFSQLKSDDIQKLLSQMDENGLSYSSIKKVYDTYNNMFKYAIDVRLDLSAEDNPMRGVIMPSIKKFQVKEIRPFTPEEITLFAAEAMRRFKTGAPVYKYGHAFVFLLNTGLRESEFCALNKDDIDFDQNLIKVTKSVYTATKKASNGTNKYTAKIGTPKTRNSVRYVPMSAEAAACARTLMQEFPKTKYLVYSNSGAFVRPDTLSKQFASILEHSGLEKRGIHSLRHTFVSVLFEKGVDIPTIAEIAGDTEETIKKTYLHLYKSRKARAVQGLFSFLL